jgi:hypothetical protein
MGEAPIGDPVTRAKIQLSQLAQVVEVRKAVIGDVLAAGDVQEFEIFESA